MRRPFSYPCWISGNREGGPAARLARLSVAVSELARARAKPWWFLFLGLEGRTRQLRHSHCAALGLKEVVPEWSCSIVSEAARETRL